MSDLTPYLGLITSEHADKPNFLATVAASLQPISDSAAIMATFPSLYDLDTAVGVQLDVVGEWVGRPRYLKTPLTGVYFALDNVGGPGFDLGTWQGKYDPITGLTALPDEAYRTLLRAKILANMWDGSIPGAYTAWNTIFAPTGYMVVIQDNGDMSMVLGLVGRTPDAVTLALFTGGYLTLKPAGVRISFYATPTADAPLFGFDAQAPGIAGFDTGAYAAMITP